MGTDGPPENDCCTVCHDDFNVPCQANCSHWFCGFSLSLSLFDFDSFFCFNSYQNELVVSTFYAAFPSEQFSQWPLQS
ncbi:hypothetical protein FEM48_Zijuj06G0175200 [Ziziphus jujuba var. spinosa]|uniref:Uncharacterized protein n=1 Tax=Ziziphus jujuba var. spinosa TaxID=714518 RepID=A0A978VAN0_ZIZJJ|nr:hypothetical protein FEM48_Zijuj06G0175200 [Ziziphus jujuba var. spinosa]